MYIVQIVERQQGTHAESVIKEFMPMERHKAESRKRELEREIFDNEHYFVRIVEAK